MNYQNKTYLGLQSHDIELLRKVVSRKTDLAKYPFAAGVKEQVLIYQADVLTKAAKQNRQQIMSELHHALSSGPGVFVIKQAITNIAVIDEQTSIYQKLLESESSTLGGADHFAAAGANGRIWNALQKCALYDPKSYVSYYSNELIGLAAEAWLGPGWQLTSQVNSVPPGSQAQQVHRDYHLGFQSNETVQAYPKIVHFLSGYLTLQGAVAHTDMPIETGPTLLLPYSQQYEAGYLAYREQDVKQFFETHAVQLPLEKGDMLFFNPALFHAAGSNITDDKHRVANLLQISSAFGRAMEAVDRNSMMLAIYPALLSAWHAKQLTLSEVQAVIQATAEGYAFPTNLDQDPPLNGLSPETFQQLMLHAITADWSVEKFDKSVRLKAQQRMG